MCVDHLSRRRFLQLSAVSAAALTSTEGMAAQPSEPSFQASPRPQAGGLADGMIDFHVHTYPDNFGRTVSAVDAALAARERGLRGIVLKGSAFETMTRAAEAR